MANIEKSFIDRAQRGHLLYTKITGFAVLFSPPNGNLNPANFGPFMTLIDQANEAVEDNKTLFSAAVTARRTQSLAAQKLMTQVVNFVKTNPAWEDSFPRIKQLCDQIREIRP